MRFLVVVTAAGDRAARLARVVVPDPWVIALLLAAATMASAMVLGRKPPLELMATFAFGFQQPDLLAFGFQMTLVLLSGSAIARAPVVERALARLADATVTGSAAAALVAAVSMLLSLFNWGLGLVAGALLAREVGRSFVRRGLPLNFAAVGAAGFVGIAVWHGGLSGSAPLKVASESAFGPAIPVTDTLLSPMNLIVEGLVVVAFTALFWAFGRGPMPEGAQAPPPLPSEAVRADEPVGAERLERSPWVLALVALPLLVALVRHLTMKGLAGLTLDVVILVFVVAGMILHPRPGDYARAFAEGAREAVGILLQFPLYFGIIAVARDGGLVEVIARLFNDLARAGADTVPPSITVPVFTYLSACAINVFVPSGGAQWVVQSPLVLEMATALDVDRAPLVLSFAYGDQTTNLLQPFWALPLLSLTGLRARDLMGYTLVACAVEMAIVLTTLVVFSW